VLEYFLVLNEDLFKFLTVFDVKITSLVTGVAFYNEIIHMYHFSENGELRQHLQVDIRAPK